MQEPAKPWVEWAGDHIACCDPKHAIAVMMIIVVCFTGAILKGVEVLGNYELPRELLLGQSSTAHSPRP